MSFVDPSDHSWREEPVDPGNKEYGVFVHGGNAAIGWFMIALVYIP